MKSAWWGTRVDPLLRHAASIRERGQEHPTAFVLVSGVTVSLSALRHHLDARAQPQSGSALARTSRKQTRELQGSRESLISARERERRRLRRDLHDGVGPQLAALMLELETASELVSDNRKPPP